MIRFKLKKFLYNKFYIICIFIVCSLFALYNIARKASVSCSIAECILLSTDDKLIMLVLFSILPLLLYFRSCTISANDIQAIVRCPSKKRWYCSCIVQITLVSALFVMTYVLMCYIVGSLLHIPSTNTWDQSLFSRVASINPDSFDAYGEPLINAISNNVSPNALVVESMVLLILRNIFFASIYCLFLAICQQKWAGVLAVILIAWVDSYFYSILRVKPFYLLPHEFSIATAINGVTLPSILKIVYWLVLILGLQSILYLYTNFSIEKAVIVNMKSKDTWEDFYE